MIKAKPAASVPPVFFEHDNGLKVQIRDVPDKNRRKLIKNNEETTFDRKHQKTTETDWLRFGRDFLLEAIVGWTGMTYRHLLDICKPIEPDPGVKLADPIEFTAENLLFVAENYRLDFGLFITSAVNRLNEIYAEGKKKELENL